MKRSFLLISLVFLLIPAGVSANGYLFINSTPYGAAITLDGAYIGSTPNNQSYPAGPHTVILRTSGSSDYATTVTVVDNSTVVLNYAFVNAAPTISGIFPTSGFNTSVLSSVIISGTGFSTSTGSVVLTKSGQTNITATINSWGTTSINCNLPLTGKVAGTWSIVVTNPDGQYTSSSFTVKSQADVPTLTSIDPSSGHNNSTVTINAITGTNFSGTATFRLVNPYYNDIYGTVSSVNLAGTVISGTVNLNNQIAGSYQICVYNSPSTYICGLTFTVLSPGQTTTNSSIFFQTNPEGAAIYLNNTEVGTSTFTYRNATPGTFKVLIRKSGYKDYTTNVTVFANKRTTFYAKLTPLSADTLVATATATQVTTSTTIRKSTLKVPTTWPSTTPTAESSVDPAIVIGAAGIGIGLVAFRRR